jgi:hypothetical protein
MSPHLRANWRHIRDRFREFAELHGVSTGRVRLCRASDNLTANTVRACTKDGCQFKLVGPIRNDWTDLTRPGPQSPRAGSFPPCAKGLMRPSCPSTCGVWKVRRQHLINRRRRNLDHHQSSYGMRLLSSAATCFLALYALDLYLCRGAYFEAVRELAIQIAMRF